MDYIKHLEKNPAECAQPGRQTLHANLQGRLYKMPFHLKKLMGVGGGLGFFLPATLNSFLF